MLRPGKRIGTILLVGLALSHLATSATIGFKPAVNYPVGTNPVAVAAGDFDGDGKIDLAVVNSGDASVGDDGGVSILLGNGDGTFRAAVNIPAGKNPVSIAVADFDGDGRPDLAVINFDGGLGNVGILLSNGNGTFQSPVDYATGNGPNQVAVGDFDSDQKPDLVVANGTDNTISILLGNGNGTFQSRLNYSTGGSKPPHGVAVADFNSDGKADLAVPILISGVAILLGNGDGTFQSATFYDSGFSGPTAIAPGDFNGDGKLDVFVNFLIFTGEDHNSGGDLLLGNGDGTFQLVKNVVMLGTGSVNVVGYISQADFNGDGKLDLLTVQPNPSVSQLSVWAGNGNGTFQAGVPFTAGPSPTQIVTADLNGDKSPDMVVANTGNNTISILLNTPVMDFSIFATHPNPNILHAGETATSNVTVGLNAFDSPISLTCSVQPAQTGSPTCSLNPNSVTFDGNSERTADLVITAGPAALVSHSSRQDLGPFPWLTITGLMCAAVWICRGNSGKQRRLSFFMSTFLFAGLVLQSACAGGNNNSGGGNNGGSNAQTYTVTVTGTLGNTKHSTSVTLTVQ